MTAHLAALIICVVSLVLGAAIVRPAGGWSWTAPPAGLAAAIVLALAAVRLPGHGTTAAVAIAAALALAAARLWLDRRVLRAVPARHVLAPVALSAAVLAFCSLPFLANQRVGELGVSSTDDVSFHMGQADAMRRVGAAADVTAPGYPTGPHALVAALSAGTGIGISRGLLGLLLAVPILTALTALTALAALRARPVLRAGLAAIVGVAYLAAAYLAQGAFKEPLLALFFLGFVVTLRDARRTGFGRRHLAAGVLVAAGGLASFGLAALAWFAAALLVLGGASHIGHGRGARRMTRRQRRFAMAAGLLLTVAVAGVALSSRDFYESGPGRFLGERGIGGNYLGQLDPLEALGVWPQTDFRFRPAGFVRWPGVLVAACACAYGAWWCRRRGEWALLSGAAAAIAAYVVALPATLAYFSGKALVVAAPILALVCVSGLSAGAAASEGRRRLITLGLLAAYVGAAAYSSALVLGGAHVRPADRGPDLAAFRAVVDGQPTLYLGRDNFAGWELRGAQLAGYQPYPELAVRFVARPAKAIGDEVPTAVDVDALPSPFLDGFAYVVAPRTAFASRMPPNFRPVRRSRWHVLWERTGPTGDRRILAEGEAPGAVLDCTGRRGRRLRHRRGFAYVRRPPVIGGAAAWRITGTDRGGERVDTEQERSVRQRLRLGRGTWELSLRYSSDVSLSLRAARLRTSLPASLTDPSTFFAAGRVVSRGAPVTVEIDVPRRRRLEVVRTVDLGTVVATRLGDHGRRVPLREACGRYVDWYALTP